MTRLNGAMQGNPMPKWTVAKTNNQGEVEVEVEGEGEDKAGREVKDGDETPGPAGTTQTGARNAAA